MTTKRSSYFGRKLILYILAGILLIYGAAGFIAIPIVAEKKLPEIASSVIDGKITVKDIDFNPFSLSASVEGLSVTRGSGNPVLDIERVSANLQISSILRRGAVIKSVEINGPSFDLVRSENGELNILGLLKEKKKTPSETAPDRKPDKSGSPVYFSIEKIRINKGRLSYRNKLSGFDTRVGGISVLVKNLVSKSPEEAEFSFSAKTEAGEKIDCSGKIGLFPLSADARINVKDADISKYAPFYRDLTGLSIRSGKVDVSADIDYPQSSSSESAPMISNGQLKITSLSAVDPQTGNAALEISGFSVSGIQVDLKNRSITADLVSSHGGKILCERTRDGGINFSRIVAKKPEDGNSSKKSGKQPSSSWKVRLETLNLLGYAVQYSDHVPENPVSMKIRHMNIRMYDFTLQQDSPSHWSIYSLTEQGVITAQGRIQLTPLMAELDFKMTDFGLDTADPYAAPFGINIEKGTLNVDGSIEAKATQHGFSGSYTGDLWIDDLAVSDIEARPLEINLKNGSLKLTSKIKGQTTPDGFSGSYTGDFKVDDLGLNGIRSDSLGIDVTKGKLNLGGKIEAKASQDGFSGSYAGDLGIDDFAVIDVKSGEPFLSFTHLGLENIRAGSDPMAFRSDRLIIRSPEISVIRDEQGSLTPALLAGGDKNAEAGKKPDKPAPEQKKQASESGPELAIDEIKVENGLFSFTDRFIAPAFSTSLNAVALRMSDFLLDPQNVAPFEISGRLGNQAPFTITGEIRTLQPTAHTDVDIAFSNIGIPPFTPYSGKYLGYEIQKGKLNLDLDYSIDSRELKAENHLVFNQFYLGQSVKSPDAPSLPLKFALALLRDRSGKISLDVPVEGDMSSPEFGLGGVIYSAFINVLKKIATSPFAALASLVPNAEELKYVNFTPASAQLDKQGKEKLDQLETALYDRPGLRLLIRPAADPQQDREALKQEALEQMVEAEKTESEDTRLAPDQEYEKNLKAACKTAEIDTKDLSVAEMEAVLKQTIEIPDLRLNELALQRGKIVRDNLMADGRIKAGRIFLENPQMAQKPRVEFELGAK